MLVLEKKEMSQISKASIVQLWKRKVNKTQSMQKEGSNEEQIPIK